MPAAVRADLPAALAEAAAVCERTSDPKTIAVLLKPIADYATGFRLEITKEAMAIYADLVRSYPADIVAEAIKMALAGHDDSFRLPLPATIRAIADPQFRERLVVKARLETAILKANRGQSNEKA